LREFTDHLSVSVTGVWLMREMSSLKPMMSRRRQYLQGERCGWQCGTVIALGTTSFLVMSLFHCTTTSSKVDPSPIRCSSKEEK